MLPVIHKPSREAWHSALALLAVMILTCVPSARAQTPTSQPTLWLIPHTHWEGAVFKTREEYLDSNLPDILKALALLRTNPDYRFVLDQVAYVRPFLERYPEEAAEFRKFVAEGRLQIVGGNDVMLDVNIPSGESWVRQALLGKGYYRDTLGVDVTVGWGLDTFGHHAQMPQLLKLAGYQSYWFQRGPQRSDPSEFFWQGIDGSRIAAFWLPLGYGLFYPASQNSFEFDQYARGIWNSLGEYSQSPNRVAMAGADVVEPQEALPARVAEFNRQANKPFNLRFGVPADFEAAEAHRERPVIRAELNPIFQGTYSNRIEIKQRLREDERLLTDAEKLSAWANWIGAPSHGENLNRAWEPVLFNEAHDLTSGTMVDKVYLDAMRGYDFSQKLAEEMVDANLEAIGAAVDTRPAGPSGEGSIPVAVFNTLGWPRTDAAEARVGFSDMGVLSLSLADATGRAVPVQLVDTERYASGGIKDAKLVFIARDVPALGYSLYRVVPHRAGEPPVEALAAPSMGTATETEHFDIGSIENEYYKVTFDLWTGAMTSLIVKPATGTGWEALSAPGNIVAREQDGGDFWELYGTLNGGRFSPMIREQGLPPAGSHLSNEYVGGGGNTEPGPVFAEFHITHPFGDGSFATRVRLYRGVPRVDVQTQILNNDKFVRYRVFFPTSIKEGKRFDEIPFGSIERPARIEFPAQNWTDWSDGSHGVALLNRGLPGNNVADGALLLSLMRSARITAYPFFGGYEPGVSSDLGLELGERRTFDYALAPHQGDWRQAGVYRAGMEFNHPLLARKLAVHGGTLPGRWGLLEVSRGNIVVTAFKPGEKGGLALRMVEASGLATPGVKVSFTLPLGAVSEANLLEEPTQKLDISNKQVNLDFRPYEIKTLKLEPVRSPKGK